MFCIAIVKTAAQAHVAEVQDTNHYPVQASNAKFMS